ncbi:DUF4198 domain-containing protein [Pollutibacter soli]|uniref:DUF4198 domain-containing protein n=1 Tax=Pollutibacter soli TaxID=3034157 RepID=UPI003013D9C5
MKKKITAIFISLGLVLCLAGHEFWIQPQRFHFKRGQPIRIRFQVGENFEGENWSGNKASMRDIRLHFAEYTDDIKNLLSDSTNGDSLTVQFFDEGTVLASCQTSNKFIQLEPEKFLEYLKEDGLEETIKLREEYNEKDSSGREFYQRNIKSLMQIGSVIDSTYKKTTELPLDIIPLSHPYLIKKKQHFQAKVLFEGDPLSNQLIKLWHRSKGKTEMLDLKTDEQGIVEMEINPYGQWMLSTVKIVRLPDDTTASWQSYWGSFTWGYY